MSVKIFAEKAMQETAMDYIKTCCLVRLIV